MSAIPSSSIQTGLVLPFPVISAPQPGHSEYARSARKPQEEHSYSSAPKKCSWRVQWGLLFLLFIVRFTTPALSFHCFCKNRFEAIRQSDCGYIRLPHPLRRGKRSLLRHGSRNPKSLLIHAFYKARGTRGRSLR